MDKIAQIVLPMLEGSEITLQIFLITFLLVLPLGLLIALGHIARFRPLRLLVAAYIWIMRGTPLMLQLLFVYFALPMIGLRLPDIMAALLAFTLNYAAYFAEIFRAGIQRWCAPGCRPCRAASMRPRACWDSPMDRPCGAS